jgi:hypothetical protein
MAVTDTAALSGAKRNNRGGPILTWSVTIVACAYIAWIGITLYRSTGAFRGLFASLNAQLPAVTSFVVNNYQWYYPGLFGGAVALLLAKQFFIRDKWKSLALTFATIALAHFAANGVIQALYRPLFEMAQQVAR